MNSFFGDRCEMEDLDVIKKRFKWNPNEPKNGYSLFYEMVVFSDEDDHILAAGDYSVIFSNSAEIINQAIVVHFSHVWVNPKNPSRSIVNNHMPNLAVEAANGVIINLKLPLDTNIILVGEVEPYEQGNTERTRRLKRFFYANWCVVDPKYIQYYQPDFRLPDLIDSTGISIPLLFLLIIKRINRESETEITVSEIKHIVKCLYHMYSFGVRLQDMSVVYKTLDQYPPDSTSIALIKEFPQLLTR